VTIVVDTVPRLGILRVATPMMYSSTAGMASLFAILAVLDRLGDESLYVRAVYMPIGFMFMAISSALTVTLQVRAARSLGAGRSAEVPALTGALLRLGLGVYGGVCLIMLAWGEAWGHLLGIAAGAMAPFVSFLVSMTLATALGYVGEVVTAVLRGSGATLAGAVLTTANILLSLTTFVLLAPIFGLSALPLTSGAVALLQATAGIVLLRRRGLWTTASVLGWTPIVRSVVRIGIPVGASSLILFASNLAFLRILEPRGVEAIEGFTFANTLLTALIVPAIGFGSGVAIVMNHHIEQPHVALATFRQALRLGTYGYAALTLLVAVGGVSLMNWLSSNPYAADYMRIVGPTVGCTGLILVALTVLEHTGNGVLALGMNILFFGAMILAAALSGVYGDSVRDFYWTLAIFHVAGLLSGLPTAWWLLRTQMSRGA
jgi:Na+-driven multidrug efflux pump